MMKTRTRYRLLYVGSDMIASFVGMVIFELVRYRLVPGLTDRYPDIMRFMLSTGVELTVLLFPICMFFVNYLTGYYVNVTNKSRAREFLQTLCSVAIGSMILFMTVLLNDVLPRRRYNYEMVLLIFGCVFPVVYGVRLLLTTLLKRRQTAGRRVKRALYVVTDSASEEISPGLAVALEEVGLEIVGTLRITNVTDDTAGVLMKAVEEGNIDCFVFDVPRDEDKAFRILGALMKLNLPVMVQPSPTRVLLGVVKYDSVVNTPLVDVTNVSLPDTAVAIKRAFDIVASALGLIITLPVMCVVVVAVKLSSPGPVFYRQERLGLNRKPFKLYKFRTMIADSEPTGPQLTATNDSRITAAGRVLRRYRLDELPNLWNVFKGDMSLVGPRPERSYYASRLIDIAPHYLLVHRVRPGVTSWGMVKYGYASTLDQMVERLTYDILYLQNLSLSLDIKILFYTVRTILRGEGK